MKRFFDILISVVALLMLSPVLLVVAFLARIKLGSPVLFRQQRPGLHCKSLTMFKFRTKHHIRTSAPMSYYCDR